MGEGFYSLLAAALGGLLPLVFIPISVDSYILPRVSLAFVAAGLGLVGPRRRLLGPRLGWLAVGVAVAAVVAGVLSVAPARSFIGAYTRYESWPVRLAYVGVFCLGVWSGVSSVRVARWFCVGVAVASVEAVWQWLAGSPLRPDGNLGQPGLLGVLCAMALPLAVALGGRSWRWAPVPLVVGVGLVLSLARSAWAAAAVGLLVAAWLAWPAWRRWIVAFAVGAALIGVLAFLFTPLHVLNQDTGAGRLSVWRDSVGLILRRPVFGSGQETVGLVEPEAFFDRLHSVPLDLLATQGAVGLVACLAFFGWFWWRGGRFAWPPLAGALAAYTAWGLVNFDWAPATGVFWLLAGVAWGESGAAQAVAPGAPSRLRWAWAVPALAFFVLAVVPLAADLAYHAGRVDVAARLDPLQAQYRAAR